MTEREKEAQKYLVTKIGAILLENGVPKEKLQEVAIRIIGEAFSSNEFKAEALIYAQIEGYAK